MTREQLDQIDLRRFKLAQRNAMRALKERDEAQQRLDLANADLMAWRTIVAARGLLPNNSSTNPYSDEPELEFEEPKEPETEAPRDAASLASSPNSVIEHGIATENKTRFVRYVIDRAGAVGKTPSEIRAEAINAGVDVGPGYPYSVLGKLKKSGEIVITTGGRYISRRATLSS